MQDMVLVHEGQSDGSLILQWYVNAAIYEKETAEAWIESLAAWARFLAEGKRVLDSPLPALLPEEENLLAGWEQGPALPHPAPSFPALFEHWARIQPERPAVITEQGAQSYASLNARSNAIAHALLALGVSLQEPVGVLTDRSIALPETVLAIWKSGGCYLRLVNDLPADTVWPSLRATQASGLWWSWTGLNCRHRWSKPAAVSSGQTVSRKRSSAATSIQSKSRTASEVWTLRTSFIHPGPRECPREFWCAIRD